MKNTRQECINTAIETSFFAPWENVAGLLPYVNTAYVDIKLADSRRHKQYCGVDNSLILQNLQNTNGIEGNLRLVVRVPIVPGINDCEEELRKIGEFCTRLHRLDHVQLLPYHRLGTETYKKLGRPYLLEGVRSPTAEEMARHRSVMRQYVNKTI